MNCTHFANSVACIIIDVDNLYSSETTDKTNSYTFSKTKTSSTSNIKIWGGGRRRGRGFHVIQ